MKKLVFILFAVIASSVTAQADPIDGNFVLRDGRNILRITVGNERDSRSLVRRVRNLERAVRDLQTQVYEMQDAPRTRPVTVYTCVLPTSFDGTFIGKGSTKVEARANAVMSCERGDGFPCRDDRITSCERSVEYRPIR